MSYKYYERQHKYIQKLHIRYLEIRNCQNVLMFIIAIVTYIDLGIHEFASSLLNLS